MRKKFFFLVIVFFCFFAYGLIVSQFSLKIIEDELITENPNGFFDYKGVMNVHSNLSTGSGSIQKIIHDAQLVGLDFISITDLNTKEKPKNFSGYHDQLFVFIDGEYSYLNSRILNYNAKKSVSNMGAGRFQVFLSDKLQKENLSTEDGLFVLAHPFQRGYEWTSRFPKGLDGIEIINLKSIWENSWLHSKATFLWTVFLYPFNPEFAFTRLFSYPEKEIQLWDKLNQNHPTLGFAGTDAEEKILIPSGNHLKVPTYQTMFQIVNSHVLLKSELTGDNETDGNKLSSAINKGHFYFSLDLLANPKGFISYLQNPDGKKFLMGEKVSFKEGQQLYVKLPKRPQVPFDVTIYRNGEKILTSNSVETLYQIHSPGVYRVYVRVIPTLPPPDGNKWIPWIFTNPFFITDT